MTLVAQAGNDGIRRRSLVSISAYAVVFVVLLPLLLGLWMRRLDALLHLPAYNLPLAGLVLSAGGLSLMAAAMLSLWIHGRGLPMSPFPPERLVTRGIYRCVADPIYIGAVLTSFGTAMAIGSAGGLWIVSPVLAMSASSFVLGYERHSTAERFGRLPAPLLRLPGADDERPDLFDRISVYLLVFLPWVVLYEGVNRLGVPADARSTYLAWERPWQVLPWTELIYIATYPLVLSVPLIARCRRDLRRFALRGLGATLGITLFYLLVPLVAAAKPVPADTIWAPLMRLERYSDQQATALPAFHVVWACLAAETYVAAWSRLRWLAVLLCLATGVSCVTAGMHAMLDVLAAFGAYALITRGGVIWRKVCRQAERVANSWREWRFGPIRIMSHGAYAAIGGAVGVAVAVWLGGSSELWWIVGLTHSAQLGAALWAQFVEGSPQLLRPYGYFGSVIAVIAVAGLAAAAGQNPWLLLGAMSVGGCFTLVIGRLRCLVQGCCHGRMVEASWGVRYTHPRSRVVRLSDLGGLPLHPTPVYSMMWAIIVGFSLLRLWTLAVPLPFISGSYLILMGLGRFVEEQYRGEPQTAKIGGLRLYQWLAITFVVSGAGLTAVAGPPAPAPHLPAQILWPVLALVAVITYAAYGVDLPQSNRRFSRLV